MYKDFVILFLYNYGLCALTFTLLSRKLVWYPPLFVSIMLLSIRVICQKYTHSLEWGSLISLIVTAYLYIRFFIPITYPKEEVTHEQNVSE